MAHSIEEIIIVAQEDIIQKTEPLSIKKEVVGGLIQDLAYQFLDRGVLVSTLNNIRLLPSPLPATVITTDFGGGTWLLDPLDTTSADNTGTIIVTADGGRYKRVYNPGLIYPEWWGAKGDGVTDCTSAINDAMLFASNLSEGTERGTTVQLNSGVYVVTGINIQARCHLVGQGSAVTIIKLKDGTNGNGILIPLTTSAISLKRFSFDGNNENNTSGHGITTDITPSAGSNLQIYRDKTVDNNTTYKLCLIEDVVIVSCAGDGLNIQQYNFFLSLNRVTCYQNKGYGFYNDSTDNFFNNLICERNGKSGIFEIGSNNKFVGAKSIWNGNIDPLNSAAFRIGAGASASARDIFMACEAQDNFCDGFWLNNVESATLVGCLADGNGYVVDSSPLISNGVSSGFRLDGVRYSQITQCTASNYRFNRPNRNEAYIQTFAYKEDNASYGNKIEVIDKNQGKNPGRRLQALPKNDFYFVKRPTAVTEASVLYPIDVPIQRATGIALDVDNVVYVPGQFEIKNQFSVLIDFTYDSHTGNFPRILRSFNDNLIIFYDTDNLSPVPSPRISIRVTSRDTTQFTVSKFITLVPGVKYRLGFYFKQIEANNVRFNGYSSYIDADGQTIFTLTGYVFVTGNLSTYIDGVTFNSSASPTPGRLTGTLNKYALTSDEIYIDNFRSEVEFKGDFIHYIDFSAPTNLPVQIQQAPIASDYYRNRIFPFKSEGLSDPIFYFKRFTGSATVKRIDLSLPNPRFLRFISSTAPSITTPVTGLNAVYIDDEPGTELWYPNVNGGATYTKINQTEWRVKFNLVKDTTTTADPNNASLNASYPVADYIAGTRVLFSALTGGPKVYERLDATTWMITKVLIST